MKIIEDYQQLSKSKLWALQEKAYTEFGPQAWSEKGVPFYITSNPLTVKKYVAVTLGYIRDIINNKTFDSAHPLYIFDLGAGSGRFGYLFTKYLLEAVEKLYANKIRFKYVMTDMVKQNISFLEEHPSVKPLIEKGVIDFAYYKHDQNDPLLLRLSKETLSQLINPAVIIGNYFFDTIPQDFFRVKEGVLEEGKISLHTTVDEVDSESSSIIEHLESRYKYSAVEHPEHYYLEYPDLNNVLVEYKTRFNNIPLFFPFGSSLVLRYFQKLTNNRLLMLVGDQGVATPEQMRALSEPRIDKHGTFSMPVCYHAIKTYIELQCGAGMLTTHSDPTFIVMAGVIGEHATEFRETSYAFTEHMDGFEPKDYWLFVEEAEKHLEDCSLEQLLLLLKLGHWDPINFHTFFPYLHEKMQHASTIIDLIGITDEIYAQFYPVMKEEGNFLINLGVICFELKDYKKSLFYFQEALQLMGEGELVLKNISACYAKMGMTPEALKYLDKAGKVGKH